MPLPFDKSARLSSGDINASSITNGKDQELAKWSVLKACSLNMSVGETLGAASGLVVWALSHLDSTSQTAGLEGFVTALRVAVTGKFNVPLSHVAEIEDGKL